MYNFFKNLIVCTIVCIALPNLVAAESFENQVQNLKNQFEKTVNPLEQAAIGAQLKEIVQNEVKKNPHHPSVDTVKSYGLAPKKFANDFFSNFHVINKTMPETLIKENQQLKVDNQQLVLKQNGITEKQIEAGINDKEIMKAINSVDKLGGNFSKIGTSTDGYGIHAYVENEKGEKTEIAIFKNQEQLETFTKIQLALKGNIALSAMGDMQKIISELLTKQDIMEKMFSWIKDNVEPEKLSVTINGDTAIIKNAADIGVTLYECKPRWAIAIKIAYPIIYQLQKNPYAQKAIGFDTELVEKIEKLNKALGKESLDESLDYLSKIKDLTAKLELANEEANGLDALMGSLPKEFQKVSDITKFTMQSFQIIMNEIIANARKSTSGPLEDLKKLTEYMLGGIPQIKENKLPRDLLLNAYSIAAKYDTKLSDKVIEKFEDLIMSTKKGKDLEDAYQNIFIELYHMKVQVNETAVVDKDPLFTLLQVIETYLEHFNKVASWSQSAKTDENTVKTFLIAKKNEITQKIKEKNYQLYQECLSFYEAQKNNSSNECRPLVLEFLAQPQFAIFLLKDSPKETNKFLKFEEMSNCLEYLSDDQKKAAFAYLYEVIRDFKSLESEYKIMSRANPQIKLDQIEKLRVQVKNSLGDKSKEFKKLNTVNKDFVNFKNAMDDLLTGVTRAKSLIDNIDLYTDIATKLPDASEAALDSLITENTEVDMSTQIKEIISRSKKIKVAEELDSLISDLKALNDAMCVSKSFVVKLNGAQKKLGVLAEPDNLKTVFTNLKEKALNLIKSTNKVPDLNIINAPKQNVPIKVPDQKIQIKNPVNNAPIKPAQNQVVDPKVADGLILAEKYLKYFETEDGKQAFQKKIDGIDDIEDMIDAIKKISGALKSANPMLKASIPKKLIELKQIADAFPLLN